MQQADPSWRHRPRTWTLDRVSTFNALVRAGARPGHIAHELGVSIAAVRAYRLRKGERQRSPDGLTHAQVAAMLGLVGRGGANKVSRWVFDGYFGPAVSTTTHFLTRRKVIAFLHDPLHWHRWEPEWITDAGLRTIANQIRGQVHYQGTDEVAAIIGVSPGRLIAYLQEDVAHARRDGKHFRINVRDIPQLQSRVQRVGVPGHSPFTPAMDRRLRLAIDALAAEFDLSAHTVASRAYRLLLGRIQPQRRS